VRRALGASTFRLLRLHAAEGVLIGAIGGVVAIAIASLVGHMFEGRNFLLLPETERLRVDGRVLAFTFALALSTGLMFGLIPGLANLRLRGTSSLSDAGRSSTSRGSARVRAGLILIQVAGSVMLLAAGLLFVRTIQALRAIDLGFDPAGVTVHNVDPEPQGYARRSPRLAALRDNVLQTLEGDARVEHVALAAQGVPQTQMFIADIRRTDMPANDWRWKTRMAPVSAAYFETLRIPLLKGRTFEAAEERGTWESGSVVELDASTARQIFGDTDPIGQLLVERSFKGDKTHRVIGVVGDTRAGELRDGSRLAIYLPMHQSNWGDFDIVVRSTAPTSEIDGLVRRAVASIDAAIPLAPGTSMNDAIADAMRDERMFLKLIGSLGILAATLAAIGLYGLAAYTVVDRRREIGIRIALGARVHQVVRMVTSQTAALVAAGSAIGLVGAAYLSRILESRLFGIERLDATSFAGATLLFALVSLVACAAPVRAATAIDPVEALRAE
jgi:predicted permease